MFLAYPEIFKSLFLQLDNNTLKKAKVQIGFTDKCCADTSTLFLPM